MSKQSSCCSLADAALSMGEANGLAPLFKALGDPVRLRLMSMIASHPAGEACVCDLIADFDLSGPTISHHLKILRDCGLVSSQRRGTWVYYRALPAALEPIAALAGSPSDQQMSMAR
ncbi:MAG: metalloregulator ArsR/SmtB family transcription factor [Ornithinimicrobium sp.]